MKELVFFGELVVQVSEEDWDFMCKNRLFSQNPDEADIRAEFVSGTGITPDKKHFWDQASERFAEYIQNLREISCLDINAMARNTLTEEEKYPFKRDFYEDVIRSIQEDWVTFLLGPRKCGKTVCLKQIKEEYENAEYVDFKENTEEENRDIFLKVQESIKNDEKKIYLLDEITYAPYPETSIYTLAGLFTEYNAKNTKVVIAGSPPRALEQWSGIGFGGCHVGNIRIGFLSYAEWLKFKNIEQLSAENYERFLYESPKFCGLDSI